MSLPLDVQLDVDTSGGSFADVAYRWFDEVSAAICPDARRELATLPAVSAGEGAPGTAFGVLEVTRHHTEVRTCSEAGLAWLRGDLLGGQPPRTDIWFGVRDDRGQQRGQTLNATTLHDPSVSPDWLSLHGYPRIHELLGPGPEPARAQRQWIDLLLAFADRTNPGYGHIGLYHDDGRTALESTRAPGKTVPLAARYREYAVNECRRYLRGYSWVTIVPRELVPVLGGTDRLVGSGAFSQVRELAAGGVWLRATEDYREFDDAALTRVFEAVAPALRPGLPRDLNQYLHPGENPYRVVLRDAAELGAQER